MTEFLNMKDVATLLKLHPITIQRYCNQGKLTYYQVGARKRFKQEDVDKFLEENKHDATGPKNNTNNPFNVD